MYIICRVPKIFLFGRIVDSINFVRLVRLKPIRTTKVNICLFHLPFHFVGALKRMEEGISLDCATFIPAYCLSEDEARLVPWGIW